jgi:tRNA modification GTPase
MNNGYYEDTIIALATPYGNAALAVIRVSGSNAHEIVKKVIFEQEKFSRMQARKIALYRIKALSTEEIIDEVTTIKYFAPETYTGEPMVEITCHGGSIVVKRILEALIDAGARYAGKGEFTKRAFLNGKTGLEKAEYINQIINSKTVQQQKNAVKGYLGGYEYLIKKWKQDLIEILVKLETEIEFNEDHSIIEKGISIRERVFKSIMDIRNTINIELQKRRIIKEIEQGIDVAIIGPTNAGKSTLMNVLVGFERSIVDHERGTTRDFVTEIKNINDMQIKFIDTAGLTKTENRIEKKGIERTKDITKASKVIIWVTAANDDIKEQEKELQSIENKKVIGIINKCDIANGLKKEALFKELDIQFIKTSLISKHKAEIEAVIKFITDEIKGIYDNYESDCIIANKRQETILESICLEINTIEKHKITQEELLAQYIREILEKLDEFTGKVTTEEVLNQIFDEFCIGK